MRELVYLSDRKLEQFLPTLRSFWPRPKVNLKAHGVEVGLDPMQDPEKSKLKRLAKVIAHIEKSARWFLDPAAAPGQWVHFEAPLNYLVVNRDDRDLVFFVDPNTASPRYPTGGTTRLVLHCSGTHLRTENHPVCVTAPPGQDVSITVGRSGSAGVFTADNIQLLLATLCACDPLENSSPSPEVTRHLPTATASLLRAIDARLYPETAAWMAGYARITASFAAPADGTRYLIASPLYIEYATPPAVP